MPFDGSLVLDVPKQLPRLAGQVDRAIARKLQTDRPIRVRPLPHWYLPEQRIKAAVAVLVRARALIAEEQRWCKRSFARTWFDIPVPVHWRLARRFCAVGAIERAGHELGFSTKDAISALTWQTVLPVPDWNDDTRRTHAEVVVAFDAAIAALDLAPA